MSNQDPTNPPPGGPTGGPGSGRSPQTPANPNQPDTQVRRVAGQQANPQGRPGAQRTAQPMPSANQPTLRPGSPPVWPTQAAQPQAYPTMQGYAAQGQPPAQPYQTQFAMQGGQALAVAPTQASRGAGAGFALPIQPTSMNILVARIGAFIGLINLVVSLVVVVLAVGDLHSDTLYAAGAFVSLAVSAIFALFFWNTAQFAFKKREDTIRQTGQQRAGGEAPQPGYAPAAGAPLANPPGRQPPAPYPNPAPTPPTSPAPPVSEAPTIPVTQEETIEAIPFKQMDPAQFEVHEPPASEGDRYPDTAPVAELGDGDWAVLGVSLRGLSHKHDAKFREDAIAGAVVGPWQLAVVADGGGAYRLSRVGSNVGAQAALQGMRSRLRELEKMPGSAGAEGMRTVLAAGFNHAYTVLEDEAQKRGVTSRDLYTTLLLVAHRDLGGGKHLVGGAQVGDGAVVARVIGADGERRLIRLNTPDIGAANNETVFFQSVAPDEWQSRIFTEIIEGAQCYCLAMTDGIADDFTPLERELGRLEEPLFKDVLAGKPKPKDAVAAVMALLDYRRPGSFDDRSLVCIYNTRGRPWK